MADTPLGNALQKPGKTEVISCGHGGQLRKLGVRGRQGLISGEPESEITDVRRFVCAVGSEDNLGQGGICVLR